MLPQDEKTLVKVKLLTMEQQKEKNQINLPIGFKSTSLLRQLLEENDLNISDDSDNNNNMISSSAIPSDLVLFEYKSPLTTNQQQHVEVLQQPLLSTSYRLNNKQLYIGFSSVDLSPNFTIIDDKRKVFSLTSEQFFTMLQSPLFQFYQTTDESSFKVTRVFLDTSSRSTAHSLSIRLSTRSGQRGLYLEEGQKMNSRKMFFNTQDLMQMKNIFELLQHQRNLMETSEITIKLFFDWYVKQCIANKQRCVDSLDCLLNAFEHAKGANHGIDFDRLFIEIPLFARDLLNEKIMNKILINSSDSMV